MRLCRYATGSAGRFGIVTGDRVVRLDGDPFGLPGDVMRVEVEGVGVLTNPVVDWPEDT